MSISRDYEDLLEDLGPIIRGRDLSTESRVQLFEGFPKTFMEFIEYSGLSLWADGLFQFCGTDEFSDLIRSIFQNDEDFKTKDFRVFGFSAFGNLFAWSNQNYCLEIRLMDYTIFCRDILAPDNRVDGNISIMFPFSRLATNKQIDDLADINEKPLFKRAVKMHGSLELGECYGFIPALPLGGSRKVENLKRMRAREHFTFLSQLGRLKFMDYSNYPGRVVREIG